MNKAVVECQSKFLLKSFSSLRQTVDFFHKEKCLVFMSGKLIGKERYRKTLMRNDQQCGGTGIMYLQHKLRSLMYLR